ncbi:hypothetical protein ASPZODRAFT_131230 [Penicilliopsis zonata CBS 506.65]|uniref:DUF1772 domain-containing protein n=1 Tax=Penicilliopsis zonata CBS 506.65 TaxID=1073090 RepID=A0A1L9SKE9_9EURO|nr:hypothetical protein ASPZODRAFT_131230 [Penicilliopsis zonata CBS 506.65]OJJ47678.1 hypothetical protein ASPZODRAFT_131230 [Penicilliopsis zonata CBS 506.65]
MVMTTSPQQTIKLSSEYTDSFHLLNTLIFSSSEYSHPFHLTHLIIMSTDVLRTAQAVGIIGSALASGGIFSFSFFTVPALVLPARNPETPLTPLTEPTPGSSLPHITHQWLACYNMGKSTLPFLAGTSAAAYAYLAWALRDQSDFASGSYLIAAVASAGIIPYTLLVMGRTNARLEAHATRDDPGHIRVEEKQALLGRREAEDREVPALLVKWSALNATRAIFPLIGAAVGFYATISV